MAATGQPHTQGLVICLISGRCAKSSPNGWAEVKPISGVIRKEQLGDPTELSDVHYQPAATLKFASNS